MDKKWTKSARESDEYQNGLEFFLDYAYAKGKPHGNEISCPGADCYNSKWFTRNVVRSHLIAFGFQKGYDTGVRHGEKKPKPGDHNDNQMNHEEDQIDDIDGLLHERFRDVVQEENEVNVGLNEDAKKFYNLVEEAKQDLYPGCKNFSKLSFTMRLYLLKCLYGWSNVSFNALLELLREALPLLNIPDTFNKTKCMIKDLGLDYKKIDACPNDCMIYWKDHENDTFCHVCGTPRWNEDVERKPGRLHCHGRTTTPTLLKRNEEIAKLKREHVDEVKQLIQEMQEKHRQDKEATERKLQLLLKVIVSQNTADLDMEALAALVSAPTADANSVLRSSTSTHAPNDNQMMNNDDIDEEVQDFEDEEM